MDFETILNNVAHATRDMLTMCLLYQWTVLSQIPSSKMLEV